jgi:phage tail-like protein
VEGEPIGAGNFVVDLGGEVVGCSQVLGLGYEPEHRRVAPVTLRRAAGRDGAMWSWARSPEPRTVTVRLLDAAGTTACTYVLHRARPIRWNGPVLDAAAAEVATEELVLAADDLEVRSER